MTDRLGFGVLLRMLRQERSMSQAQVGRPHYTRAFISALELGKANPSAEALDHIARALGVSLEVLLDSELVEVARPTLFLDLAERCADRQDAETAAYVLDLMGPEHLQAQKHVFRYLLLRARVAILRSEWERARAYLDKASANSSVQTYDEQALVLYYEAVVHHLKDETSAALEHYRTAYLFLARVDEPDLRFATNLSRNIGTAFWRLDQIEPAHRAYEQALEAARDLGDPRAEAAALVGLANCLRYEQKYEEAVAANERALAIYDELNCRAEATRSYNNLGACYARWGRFDRARELLATSLELNGDCAHAVYSYNELAGIDLAEGSLEQAEEHVRRAIDLGEHLDDHTERAYSFWLRARLHRARCDLEQAIKDYYRAARLLVQVENVGRLAALQVELTSLVASGTRLAESLEEENKKLYSVGEVIRDTPLHGPLSPEASNDICLPDQEM